MSIKHNPPHGTILAKYVEELNALWHKQLWDSEDERYRALGIYSLKQQELRSWKWPEHIFIQEIVLPLIEAQNGAAAVQAHLETPSTLRDYAKLHAERLEREAAAHRRGPQEVSTAWAAELAILATLMTCYVGGRSLNENFKRVGEKLGVDRGVVRRIFRSKAGKMLFEDDGPAALKAVSNVLGIASGRRFGRIDPPRSPLLSNKPSLHLVRSREEDGA
ncbi:hypothetical protein [Rhizobium sp. NFR03]|uniref:hypothetical protein n=1 Tax=Rhizobium sp. NFR03 TaxID=1566263 RepID=UPI0008C4F655|nr:hypothetical protein [Rhizobium sp. NFR03]SES44278.1 hypothetical protein SAMN03159406_04501 [Rhizobium sp. NFR03]